MPFLPKAIASLVSDDPTVARISANLRQAVQPTLDFLNTYIGQGSDGSLRFLRSTIAQGPFATLQGLIAQGAIKLLGDVLINGNVYVVSRTGNGFVIQPPVVGPAFYITNPAGTQANFLVYGDGGMSSVGQIGGANVVSGAGFKTIVKLGGYWNTAPGANATFSFGDAVQNAANGSMGFTPFYEKATHAGSVVGLSINEAGPNVAAKTIYVYKNNAEMFRWTTGAAGNNATFWNTWPKGQYTFLPGDTINVYASVGSTANTQLTGYITYELSA